MKHQLEKEISALESQLSEKRKQHANLLRQLEGIPITCSKCGRSYKVLLKEIEEEEFEEPFGGFSTYLVTRCPCCKEYFEPNSEIYKLYYHK